MKAFKSVFSALAALFLTVSLTGCSDGEKTADPDTQGKAGIRSASQGGNIFSLPPGTSIVYVDYSSEDVKYQRQAEMLQLLEEQGIRVNARTSYGMASTSALRLVEPLDEKKTFRVTIPGVERIAFSYQS